MQRKSLVAAAVAVAVTTLATSCEKFQSDPVNTQQAVSVIVDYGLVRSGSMYDTKAAPADNESIVAALNSLLPTSIRYDLQEAGSKDWAVYETGQPVTFTTGKIYTFATSVSAAPESETLFSASSTFNRVAGQPFIKVETERVFTAADTELTLPATYDCFALVAPAAAVLSFKISEGGTWKELPSSVVDGWRISFVRGDWGKIPLTVKTADGYQAMNYDLPSCSVSAGKYFVFSYDVSESDERELTLSAGLSISTEWSAAEW